MDRFRPVARTQSYLGDFGFIREPDPLFYARWLIHVLAQGPEAPGATDIK